MNLENKKNNITRRKWSFVTPTSATSRFTLGAH